MKLSWKTLEDTVTPRMLGMLDRARDATAFLNTVAYEEYKNAQRKRWISENKSEGTQWKSLEPKYAKRKLTKFAAYPGAGTKVLIGTQRLYNSIVGDSNEHYKLTSGRTLKIFTRVPYAQFVDDIRTISEFGPNFQKNLLRKYQAYIGNSLKKGRR